LVTIALPNGVTDAELLAHLADRLVRYKIPQSFEYVAEPLRDDDGKVRRSALRDQRIAARASPADPSGPPSAPSTADRSPRSSQ
jgi:acyl-CoA synthetase (AMP-forming)/AMP-acid ligase II